MSGGSQQLRTFRRARRDGSSIEVAAELAGIPIGEANLHAEADAIAPPPPECFEPISHPRHRAAQQKEVPMARTARKPKDDDTGEVKKMDFERVKSIYLNDIAPAKSEASSKGQTVAEAMKIIKKQCHVEPQGAQKAFSAFRMEDAHREIHIRSMVGVFNALMGSEILTCNFGDLVDIAEGKVPAKPRPRPKLVTIPGHPDDDSDLADAGGGSDPKDGSDGDEFEATPEELAKQEGRKSKPKADA